MKIGYLRVSTIEQNEDRQILELKTHGVEKFFTDKQSGKNFNREEYQKMKSILRAGDEIYFHELDRLGRNKKMIKEELEEFQRLNVVVRILDIPTTLMNFAEFGDMQRSIMEMINNILVEVLSTQAEAELNKNKKRQAEGIAAAKKAGKYKKCGRPKKELPKEFEALYEQYKAKKITATVFAKLLGYKNLESIYPLIKRYEESLKENKNQ